MLLTVSHGQAAIDRGFSINKDAIIDTNKHERTVVARRMILDGISNLLPAEHHGDVLKNNITDEMLR